MTLWPNRQQLSTSMLVAGCFFLNLTTGLGLYYGNLSTYTNSYFMFHHHPGVTDVHPIWVGAVVISTFSAGMSAEDWLERKVNDHVAHVACLVLFNAGIYLTYLTLQHSVGLMIVTFALTSGFTSGLITMQCLKLALKAVPPSRFGIVSAVISSAAGFGAAGYNYVITAHINEDNVAPDYLIGNMVYFSQSSVLDKVPSVFIMIGSISSGFLVVGYLLEQLSRAVLCGRPGATEDSLFTKVNEEIPVLVPGPKEDKTCHSQELFKGNNHRQKNTEQETEISSNNCEQAPNLKPSEDIRARSFYLLCMFVGINAYGLFVTSNYYKFFGLLWIEDDRFMSNIGSIAAICVALARIATGIFCDVIGIKHTIVVLLIVNSIGMNLWYFAPRLDRWMYLVCCQVIVGFQSINYHLCSMAASSLYGIKHIGSISRLLLLPNITVTLFILPFGLSYLIERPGWFSIVFVETSASTIATLFLVLFFPTDINKY